MVWDLASFNLACFCDKRKVLNVIVLQDALGSCRFLMINDVFDDLGLGRFSMLFEVGVFLHEQGFCMFV